MSAISRSCLNLENISSVHCRHEDVFFTDYRRPQQVVTGLLRYLILLGPRMITGDTSTLRLEAIPSVFEINIVSFSSKMNTVSYEIKRWSYHWFEAKILFDAEEDRRLVKSNVERPLVRVSLPRHLSNHFHQDLYPKRPKFPSFHFTFRLCY